ncbi:peptide chain release factor N(5)-glutamine methyltransferase [Pseudoalteromonas sp. T1lg75]|uniref:peptide chain release factor N(5)-glutamine methyltransferase n=1 Tax=Pseudoalteromonas sp. T1lg75 TaxID=2077102 RepID=UPI0018FEA6B4|nr:peptide chain release factor N(5)-glutamine methyltransferase [Pseudoalteromonas sp. T1lg75]
MALPSIDDALSRATQRLQALSDSPKLDAQVLMLHVLQQPRSYLFAWGDRQLSEQQYDDFIQLLEKRCAGHPVAHLTGIREFWSLPIMVNNSTLIPRPDTETLVELALALPLQDNAKVLDLGTGTGAIALALASERPNWQIDAVDASQDAVALALRNKQNLELSNVHVMHSDWFSALEDGTYDLIVSNPPYIDAADPHLQQGDVRFEPLSALVAAQQGLADIAHIIIHAKAFLARPGVLMFEHGYEQGAAVRQLFIDHGYIDARTERDLGDNDRITLAKLVLGCA